MDKLIRTLAGSDIFNLAIEASASGQLLIDANGIIVAMNHNIEEIFGYPKQELLGCTVEMLLPAQHQQAHVELRKEYLKNPSTRRMGMGRELYGKHKNGKKIPVEIGLNAIEFEGESFVLTSVVDISQRENTRKISEAILEASPNGLLIINREGKIVLVNHALEDMFHYQSDELIGKDLECLLPDRYKHHHPDLRAQFFQTPSKRSMGAGRDLMAKRKDGTEFFVEIGLNVLHIDKELHVLALVVDISTRKKIEQENEKLRQQIQLSQRLDSLGVLVGGMAHDFNNILVAILGHAEIALLELPKNSPINNNLNHVRNASLKASNLIRQMLSYAGKVNFSTTEVHVNEIIEEILGLLEIAISKKTIIRLDFSNPLPLVKADAGQLQQVIMNLITNAAESIGDVSGIISISTSLVNFTQDSLKEFLAFEHLKPGHYVMIEVADTGLGMSKDIMEHMFDPFFTTKHFGRGLGLSSVIGIIRGHQGSVRVYSEKGRGTKFSVIIPAPDELNIAHPERNPMNEYFLNKNNKKLLVIDDEEHVRTVLSIMFGKCGFDTILAKDGKEGLMLARSSMNELEAIFLDMNMPYMNGPEVFREVRQMNPDIPIIIMSGYNEHEASLPLAGKSIDAFLQKPFEFMRVVDVLKRLMAEAR